MIRIALLLCLSTAAAFAADPNPFTTEMMKSYTERKQNFVESAALMPEEAYAYRLTPQQQSFGEWMYHAGIANFYYCQRYGAAPADRAVVNAGKRSEER